ncbi:MAG: hypothetical protein WCP69_07875 [Bacteroidota bacterium]
MFNNLLTKLEVFNSIETKISENWGYLSIEGTYNQSVKDFITQLCLLLKINDDSGCLTIKIDNETVDVDEIESTLTLNSSWLIHINKLPLIEKYKTNHYTNFFFSKDEFDSWSENLDPFSPKNPINNKNPLNIIVKNLHESFGGPNLLVCNELSAVSFDSFNYKLPAENIITETVHVISQDTIVINPKNHLISFGNIKNKSAIPFFNNSAIVLTSCLISEFYNSDKIILRGIKRIQLQLSKKIQNAFFDLNYITNLREVVEWVYEDKVETRIKLFIDRITLDLDFEKSYAEGLIPILESSYQQAKERYNFVIIERKDQYLKELRELLKDVKAQSDLYSTKIRSLLSNLLRDVLAGFLLVGFSFFTKVSEITKLNDAKLIDYVFKGFAVYFILSAIFQSIVDLYDIKVSKQEMYYWKNITREFLPKKEFEKHMKDSLRNRKISISVLYPLTILVYFIIAYLSWYFPSIWNTYLIK